MDPTLTNCLTGAVALVMGTACLHKARDRTQFEESLAAYEILPNALNRVAARGLITLEAIATLSLIGQIFFEPLRPMGSILAVLLLVLYSGAIAINLIRGRRDLDCGCDGPGKARPISPMLLARNGFLMAMAFAGALAPPPRPMLALDLFSIVFAVAVFGLLYQTLIQLGQTARSPFSPHDAHARKSS